MALRGQIVDLVGAHLPDHLHETHRVRQIAEVEEEAGMPLQMRDPVPEIHAAAPDDPVDLVPLFEQELGQVRTVLPRYACDQCLLHAIPSPSGRRFAACLSYQLYRIPPQVTRAFFTTVNLS